jgi:threonine dehydrogenase-like Zn-dependent dehydrogenase
MKAVVWQGPEEMSVEEVPEPDLQAGMVVLRPEAVGICGSEVEGYLGKMGNRTPPLVMGHEFAGTVVEVGEGVNENLVGRTVAVNPLSSDGTCRLCRAGLANLCPNRTLIGIHYPGGFAELARAPVENVYPLPEGFSGGARIGALAEPLANGVHAARLRGTGEAVEHAVVIGAGTIGLMCLQAAVLDGIPHVSVVEPHEARREQAMGLGAQAAYSSGTDCRETLEATTEGLGPDLVIDAWASTTSCVGKSPSRDPTPTRRAITSRRSIGSSMGERVSGNFHRSCPSKEDRMPSRSSSGDRLPRSRCSCRDRRGNGAGRGPLGQDGRRGRGEQRHRACDREPLRRRGSHSPRRRATQGGDRRRRGRAYRLRQGEGARAGRVGRGGGRESDR